MDDPVDALAPAVAFRETGAYADAGQWLSEWLAVHPENPDGWALLAHIRILARDLDGAEAAVSKAAAIEPGRPAVQRSTGRLLLARGRPQEAINAAMAAAQAAPADPENAQFLAACYNALQQDEPALALLDRVLSARPRFAEALALRALIRTRRGDAAGAIRDAEQALDIKPFLPHVWGLLGMLLHGSGDRGGAIAALREAHQLDPANAGYMINLGEYLRQDGDTAEAIPLLEQGAERAPGNAVAWANLGTALQQAGQRDAARAAYRRALEISPGLAVVANNLGGLARDDADWDDALAHFDRALAANPDFAAARANRATALMNLGRLDEAETELTEALVRQPDLAEAHWTQGVLALMRGDFTRGWAGYERRWEMERISTPRRRFDQPLWQGHEPVEGRSILVQWEQGLGDTIQFSRYVPLLAARGARVLFAPQPKLRRLFGGMPGGQQLVELGQPDLISDCHVPLLSLPRAMGTRVETVPADIPYLAPDPDVADRWRQRIGGEGFRIGLCWSGSARSGGATRFFPLAALEGIAAIPGVRLISLQVGEGLDQLAMLPAPMQVETLGGDFDAGPDAFVDSAAAIAACDLVISGDTALAHLAGALGARTWVALRDIPDWRWMLGRSDSPWYPTMRLFRQPHRGDWTSVFATMETELRSLMQGVGG